MKAHVGMHGARQKEGIEEAIMDHLSDILNGAVSTTPDEPCFVIRQDSSFCEQVDDCTMISNHDVDCFDEDENVKSDDELATAVTTAILRCLSYRQAQDALWQHQFWLAAQAEQKTRLATAAGGGSTSSSTTAVVVAYLASNSMDYILSVMACSSPITTGATTTTTPCNMKEEEKSHRQRFLPALLNTRWTANEAVAALILRGNDDSRRRRNNRSRSSSTTLFLLLLYGPGFEIMANNIVTKLNNHNNDNDTAARICGCWPIPTFAMHIAMSERRPQQVFVQPQLQQQKFRTTSKKDVASCTGKVDSSSCRPVRPGVMILDAQDEIQRLEDAYYKRRPFSRNHSNCRNHEGEDDDDDDTALIVFTSGTTSAAAKGVKLSHASILIQAWAKLTAPCRYNTETVLLISPSAVPFFHVGGLTSILAVWLAGGTLLQMQNSSSTSSTQQQQQQQSGTFNPEIVLQSLQPPALMMTSPSYDTPSFLCCYCNTLVLVPAMLHALQQQHHSSSNIQQRPGRHVQTSFYPFVTLVLIGGQSASPTQLDFARQCFPNARLVQTYACTEAASSITFCNITRSNAPRPAKAAPISMMPMTTTSNTVTTAGGAENYLSSGDCVGQPPSHIQVALLRIPPHWKQDQHDSSSETTRSRNQPHKISSNMMISQPWQVGVIATRGPHVMNGYWRDNTDITSNDCNDNITCDGWLITNDLGFWASDSMNDNNNCSAQPDLYFCGRTTDTIRTGGETVMALEVERILLQHPSIDQVAVFGVPDERYGQAVACAIVLVKSTDINNNNNNTENRHRHSLLLLDQVRQWCKQRGLAGYKCPQHVFYMTQLPRNSSGKVLKMHLRERFGHASSSRLIASKL